MQSDVKVLSDGGGKANAARIPIVGLEKVAHFFVRLVEIGREGFEVYFGKTDRSVSLVGYAFEEPILIYNFELEENKIRSIHAVLNPDKLSSFQNKNQLINDGVLELIPF